VFEKGERKKKKGTHTTEKLVVPITMEPGRSVHQTLLEFEKRRRVSKGEMSEGVVNLNRHVRLDVRSFIIFLKTFLTVFTLTTRKNQF
jgi:hypothetical protein